MHKIREWLYIGGYRDTINTYALNKFNIGAMLQLAEHVPQNGIETLYLGIDDGVPLSKENLQHGVAFIRQQKAAEKVVMSACGAGISRSTTYAIAAIKEEEGGSILDILLNIKTHHPDALPHITLWHSLNQYYGENILYQDIWKALKHSDGG